MNIQSIQFNSNYYPDQLECFNFYKNILQANNNKYKLLSITNDKKYIKFNRFNTNDNKQIKTLSINGFVINFI
jgi:hypothetical protein